jgi:hypothetical protein
VFAKSLRESFKAGGEAIKLIERARTRRAQDRSVSHRNFHPSITPGTGMLG